MIGVGVIGCGSIALTRHILEYAANSSVRIAGYFDPVPGRAAETAALHGGRAYAALDEMLADKSVDAVSVCSPNRTHREYTAAALRAGKHVLCEKPMAASAAEAREMLAAQESAGKILMVGHNQRLLEANRIAKGLIEGGSLGKVLTARASFCHGGPESWSREKGAGTWFFQKGAAGFGAAGDLGIHKFDILRWLTGAEVESVYAEFRTSDKTFADGSPIGVEDNALMILNFEGGAAAQVTVSWTHYGPEDHGTTVDLSGGTIELFTDAPLKVTKKGGETTIYDISSIQTNDNQTRSGVIDEFIDSVERGREPIATGRDGLRALEILEACARSDKERRLVRIRKGR
ncbi:dehydrogenase [Clostridia bacterium]|nr:dehydrogenase [Clostridia bacterium]